MSVERQLHVVTVVTRFQAGAGAVALRGACGLDPQRYRVTVIAGSGDGLLDKAAAAGFDVRLVPELRSEINPMDDRRAYTRLHELLAGRGADVVHTHSAKAGTLGRLAAHRVRVPRIVHTYHGFPFHEFQSPGRRAAYIGIERRLGRITDVGLCVGTAVAVEAARRGLIAPQRIRTIGVAVDEHAPVRTAATRAAARARLGLPADATIVGCVGRLAYQKAPEHFVSALDQLGRPDVIGVWIGSGELAARMERAVAAAAPRARIVLAGERTDVPELLPALDVFALPSRYEGLPVAVVEAMSCGIPVVATAVNAVGDAVVPGRTGLLIPPERPDVLAAAIGYLIDHAAAAEELAMNARAHLLGRHSDAVLAAELDRAYRPARSDGASHITGRASTDHAVTGPYHDQSMEEPECM